MAGTKAGVTKSRNSREDAAICRPRKAPAVSMNPPLEQLLLLQRTIGNRSMADLLQGGAVQAKVATGEPDDAFEQEADRVAEQVMRMPEPVTAPVPG